MKYFAFAGGNTNRVRPSVPGFICCALHQNRFFLQPCSCCCSVSCSLAAPAVPTPPPPHPAGEPMRPIGIHLWLTPQPLTCREPYKRLSSPFKVLHLNLQQRVDAVAGAAARHQPARPTLQWEADTLMEVPVTTGGVWNAVAFWFEVCSFTHRWHRISCKCDVKHVQSYLHRRRSLCTLERGMRITVSGS